MAPIRNGKNIKCKICEKEFYVPNSLLNAKTCGKICLSIYKKNYAKINPIWNKGLTKETDERMMNLTINSTKSRKGKVYPHMFIKGRVSARKGVKLSLSTRLKISISKQNPPLETRMRNSISQQKGSSHIIIFKQRLVKRIRMNKKYLEWRSNVFKRDNYHCQNCGEKGYLEAHHIVSFSYLLSNFDINTLSKAINFNPLWDVGNGITYCKPCHILLDENIGKRGVNKKIIERSIVW